MEKSEYIKLQEDGSAWSLDSALNVDGSETYWGTKTKTYMSMFAQLLRNKLYDDDVFLDLGGGDGMPLYEFSLSNVCTPMLVDISKEKVLFCKKNFGNIVAIHSQAENIPLEDKSVDYCYCSHTLEHVENLEAVLREIRRITKRAVFFALPLEPSWMKKINPSHMRFHLDKGWWLKKFKEAGFEEINHHKLLCGVMADGNGKSRKGYDLLFYGKVA